MHKYILAIAISILFTSCSKKNEYDPYAIQSAKKKEVSKSAFEVNFKKTDANLKTIHVKLNGTNSYDALFDTGCSSMLISQLELIDLLKSGTISQDDQIGSAVVALADGSSKEVPVFNIREVTIIDKDGKEHTIRDVNATVEENMGADILIGSTVIDNLAKKSYTVDLNKKTIRFE